MAVFERVINFVLWFLAVPVTVGTLPTYLLSSTRKSIIQIYLNGWLVMIAIFQVIASVFVFTLRPFSEMATVYMIVMEAMAFISLLIFMLDIARKGSNEYFDVISIKKMAVKDIVTWIVFFILLIIQIVFSIVIETPNGDDAYYVGIANIALSLDKMYTVNPYTGWSQELFFRHAMSEFPIYYAFLGLQSKLHVAIIAHTVIPPVIIGLTYMLYYRISMALFERDRSKCPVFMVLIAGIQLFGASSIYTNEVFFMTRTWQGKSILASLVIPATLLIMLRISKERKVGDILVTKRFTGYYLLLLLTNLVAGFASGLGLFLVVLYEGVVLLIITIRNKSLWYLGFGIVAMIPCCVYMLLYVIN